MSVNPSPRILEKKSKRGTITERVLRENPERSVVSFVYVSVLWIFFFGKKWHRFLFNTAYFPSYWHMSFEIGIIRKPKWQSICTYNFDFPSPNCDVTSDGDGPKNSWI